MGSRADVEVAIGGGEATGVEVEEEEECEEFVRGLLRIALGATPFPILKLELGGLTDVAVSRGGCLG